MDQPVIHQMWLVTRIRQSAAYSSAGEKGTAAAPAPAAPALPTISLLPAVGAPRSRGRCQPVANIKPHRARRESRERRPPVANEASLLPVNPIPIERFNIMADTSDQPRFGVADSQHAPFILLRGRTGHWDRLRSNPDHPERPPTFNRFQERNRRRANRRRSSSRNP